MAPNMFHIGVEEKVSITVFDAGQAVTVKLSLQDYPQRQKTFSQVEGRVENGNPVFSPPFTCFKFSVFQNVQSPDVFHLSISGSLLVLHYLNE